MRWSWFYRAIGLWSLIMVPVTHGHDAYFFLFAFVAWQQADVADMRAELRHVRSRLDATNGGAPLRDEIVKGPRPRP